MTLKELYTKAKSAERPKKPDTPAVAFIKEVAQVTKKSEIAVRRWLADGNTSCVPDALTQEVLANHFKTTASELFPQSK